MNPKKESKKPNYYCGKCGGRFYSSNHLKVCPSPIELTTSHEGNGQSKLLGTCGGPIFPIYGSSALPRNLGAGKEFEMKLPEKRFYGKKNEGYTTIQLHKSTRAMLQKLQGFYKTPEQVILELIEEHTEPERRRESV